MGRRVTKSARVAQARRTFCPEAEL
jgi:hypothetical protein